MTAYEVSLDWLAEELAFIRGGATLTTPFSGLYVSSTRIDVVQDAIRILFCDFDANPESGDEISRLVGYLENVKKFLMKTLEEEEIWIVFHPIIRVIS
ncbi:hypothetical protein BH20ACI1_BH20ACI1_18130 [soil metagenome]